MYTIGHAQYSYGEMHIFYMITAWKKKEEYNIYFLWELCWTTAKYCQIILSGINESLETK